MDGLRSNSPLNFRGKKNPLKLAARQFQIFLHLKRKKFEDFCNSHEIALHYVTFIPCLKKIIIEKTEKYWNLKYHITKLRNILIKK